jgi:hypothetical protein
MICAHASTYLFNAPSLPVTPARQCSKYGAGVRFHTFTRAHTVPHHASPLPQPVGCHSSLNAATPSHHPPPSTGAHRSRCIVARSTRVRGTAAAASPCTHLYVGCYNIAADTSWQCAEGRAARLRRAWLGVQPRPKHSRGAAHANRSPLAQFPPSAAAGREEVGRACARAGRGSNSCVAQPPSTHTCQ